jgi:hypothetical protein
MPKKFPMVATTGLEVYQVRQAVSDGMQSGDQVSTAANLILAQRRELWQLSLALVCTMSCCGSLHSEENYSTSTGRGPEHRDWDERFVPKGIGAPCIPDGCQPMAVPWAQPSANVLAAEGGDMPAGSPVFTPHDTPEERDGGREEARARERRWVFVVLTLPSVRYLAF